ncbi:hypothetical protein OF83DRAFT_1024913, partial [Amylostereum chailletii]
PSHRDLPRAFIQIASLDPLHDGGLLYERLLRDAGVPTRLEIYPGMPHAFKRFHMTTAVKKYNKLNNDLDEGIKWLLQ